MNDQFNASPSEVQSKLTSAQTLCLDFLLPMPVIAEICGEIGPEAGDHGSGQRAPAVGLDQYPGQREIAA